MGVFEFDIVDWLWHLVFAHEILPENTFTQLIQPAQASESEFVFVCHD